MKKNQFLIALKGILFSFILLSFLSSCGDDETETDTNPAIPVANFTFSPVNPKANETVTFTNTSTNATTFVWSAEGTSFSSTEKDPTFTFDTAGEFDVKLVATSATGTNETTKRVTVLEADGTGGGTGGTNNPCNLPDCNVATTTTTGSGISTMVTNSYTVINGQKRLTSIAQNTATGNLITTIEYDAQGRNIKTESKLDGTLLNYTVLEYSNNDRTVRTNSFNGANASTGYSITQLDENMRATRVDTYSQEDELQLYTVYSNFTNAEDNFPQLVENFDADGVIIKSDVHTYVDCQIIKTVSTDDSGTVIGEVNNTIDERGLLRTSVSTLSAFGVTLDTTTDYTYDCD